MISRITAFAFLIFLGIPVSGCADSPRQITETIIRQIKAAQNLDAVIENLDWRGAYEQMDSAQRQQMQIHSVEAYKKLEVENYQGAGASVQESIERSLGSASSNSSAVLKIMQESLEKSLQEQREAALRGFSETTYMVGKETINGDRAEIELIKIRDEKSVTEIVEFVRSGGEWKIAAGAAFNPAGAQGSGNQLKSLLGPSIASPDSAVVRPF
jgi:hypothetical protein